MRPRRGQAALRSGTDVAVLVLALAMVTAMPVRADVVRPDSREDDALALLARAAEATEGTRYQGTRFVSVRGPDATATMLVEVQGVPGRGTLVHQVGASTQGSAMRYEWREAPVHGSRGTLGLLARNYDLEVSGSGLVTGRLAHVVEARDPRSGLTARFWLDRQTGLLLRTEVRGRGGRLLRVSCFVKLRAGAAADTTVAERFQPSAASAPRPWPRLSGGDLASLRARGWTLPRRLPDGLTLLEARGGHARGERVVHLLYSDGLFSVSLFVQQGTLAARRLQGWRRTQVGECCVVYMRHEIPSRAMWSGDGEVYTVVADAPAMTIRRVAAALPGRNGSGHFLGRMSRGFSQLGVWLNPFR